VAEECTSILSNEIASGGAFGPLMCSLATTLTEMDAWLRIPEEGRRMEEENGGFVDLPYEFVKTAMVGHYMRLDMLHLYSLTTRNQEIINPPFVLPCLKIYPCKAGKQGKTLS